MPSITFSRYPILSYHPSCSLCPSDYYYNCIFSWAFSATIPVIYTSRSANKEVIFCSSDSWCCNSEFSFRTFYSLKFKFSVLRLVSPRCGYPPDRILNSGEVCGFQIKDCFSLLFRVGAIGSAPRCFLLFAAC